MTPLLLAGLARRRLDQRLEQVDLVVRVHVLQHCRDALQAHAGVDAGFGERREDAFRVPVILHEHEVPDLDVAVAVRLRGSRRAAGDARAVVVEDLAAGAAGPGVGHLPEVVGLVLLPARLVADAHDALARHLDVVRPQVEGFVVGLVHRDPEPLGRESVHLRQQLPGVADRILLEVIAEAEVAQHLEEGVVARGVADVLQVVVLAAGAHAPLRGGSAGIGALSLPRNTSLNCTMPELTNSSVGSLAGTSELEATMAWPLDLKYSRKLARISAEVIVAPF
jgi:hypothetical protein